MTRPHPLGITSHPSWSEVEAKRHALRVADRKRRIVRHKPPLIDRIRMWFGESWG